MEKNSKLKKKKQTGTYNHIFHCFVGVYDNFWDPTAVINTLTSTTSFMIRELARF